MSNNPLCEKIDAVLDPQKINKNKLKEGLGKYIYLINKFSGEGMDVEFKEVYSNFFDFHHFRGGDKFHGNKDENILDEYCEEYYVYMGRNKPNKELSLKRVLEYIVQLQKERNFTTIRIESVFSSKLLSMINPIDRPPWDNIVEGNLMELKIIDASEVKVLHDSKLETDERACAWDVFYAKICELYKDFVNRKTVARESWMNLFDEVFDQWHKDYFLNKEKEEKWLKWLRNKHFSKADMRSSITDVKIIDLILWCRKNDR